MIDLNGKWEMRCADTQEWLPAVVLGSVYADLIDAGKMDDPYWRNNELEAFDLMEKDYVYRRTFTVSENDFNNDVLLLICEGLDTLAHVYINSTLVIDTNNMHRTWEKDIKTHLNAGENTWTITIF